MLDFEKLDTLVGFSTGALERGDYRTALRWLRKNRIQNVELSALRLEELDPLIEDLDSLSLQSFTYVSFHAPSDFPEREEARVVDLLGKVFNRGWNIIAHPDMIRKPHLWRRFGSRLLLENMDRRKSDGRTAGELARWFAELPQARFCLDLAHARQLDTTLVLLAEMIKNFRARIAEIHISDLDSYCSHQPMSAISVNDYRSIATKVFQRLPIIIESRLDGPRLGLRLEEFRVTQTAIEPMWRSDTKLKSSIAKKHSKAKSSRKRLRELQA